MFKWCPKANASVPEEICKFCTDPCGFPEDKKDDKKEDEK